MLRSAREVDFQDTSCQFLGGDSQGGLNFPAGGGGVDYYANLPSTAAAAYPEHQNHFNNNNNENGNDSIDFLQSQQPVDYSYLENDNLYRHQQSQQSNNNFHSRTKSFNNNNNNNSNHNTSTSMNKKITIKRRNLSAFPIDFFSSATETNHNTVTSVAVAPQPSQINYISAAAAAANVNPQKLPHNHCSFSNKENNMKQTSLPASTATSSTLQGPTGIIAGATSVGGMEQKTPNFSAKVVPNLKLSANMKQSSENNINFLINLNSQNTNEISVSNEFCAATHIDTNRSMQQQEQSNHKNIPGISSAASLKPPKPIASTGSTYISSQVQVNPLKQFAQIRSTPIIYKPFEKQKIASTGSVLSISNRYKQKSQFEQTACFYRSERDDEFNDKASLISQKSSSSMAAAAAATTAANNRSTSLGVNSFAATNLSGVQSKFPAIFSKEQSSLKKRANRTRPNSHNNQQLIDSNGVIEALKNQLSTASTAVPLHELDQLFERNAARNTRTRRTHSLMPDQIQNESFSNFSIKFRDDSTDSVVIPATTTTTTIPTIAHLTPVIVKQKTAAMSTMMTDSNYMRASRLLGEDIQVETSRFARTPINISHSSSHAKCLDFYDGDETHEDQSRTAAEEALEFSFSRFNLPDDEPISPKIKSNQKHQTIRFKIDNTTIRSLQTSVSIKEGDYQNHKMRQQSLQQQQNNSQLLRQLKPKQRSQFQNKNNQQQQSQQQQQQQYNQSGFIMTPFEQKNINGINNGVVKVKTNMQKPFGIKNKENIENIVHSVGESQKWKFNNPSSTSLFSQNSLWNKKRGYVTNSATQMNAHKTGFSLGGQPITSSDSSHLRLSNRQFVPI